MDQTRIGRHGERSGRCSGNRACHRLRPDDILVLAYGQLRQVTAQALWQKPMGVVGYGLNVAVLALFGSLWLFLWLFLGSSVSILCTRSKFLTIRWSLVWTQNHEQPVLGFHTDSKNYISRLRLESAYFSLWPRILHALAIHYH